MSSSSSSNDSNEISMKYKEITSNLPEGEVPSPSIHLHHHKGFWIPLVNLKATLFVQENFKAQPSDIFLCTFPKCGTTWLKALVFSIMIRDRFDDSTNPLLTKVPHECIHSLDSVNSGDLTSLDPELPLVATHLAYTCLPQSILESDCKIIYLCREPKDTFASMWHFVQRVKESNDIDIMPNPVPLEQEVKWFVEGISAFGPYWDHVMGYWKASIDRPDSVFLLKYEDLKNDTLSYVKKLADFMGKPFTKEEETQGAAEKIVARCDIKYLRNLEVNKNGWINQTSWFRINNKAFFRKGEIGDWKNLLTEDMAKSIDHITQEKFERFGLTFPVSRQCQNNTKDT